MKITPKELALIKKIVDHNEYGEKGCLDNTPWSWAVCGDKATAAVLGSLCKKGFAKTNGTGEEASCHLTDLGVQTYLDNFGAEGTFRS